MGKLRQKKKKAAHAYHVDNSNKWANEDRTDEKWGFLPNADNKDDWREMIPDVCSIPGSVL